jgi:beta-galactosidase
MASYPLVNLRAPFIWHGGDYNPEPWPPEVWAEDMRLMQAAHFKVATVGVFSWVSLQPAEDRYTFDWLDRVLDQLSDSGRFACLATPSAAQPAWVSRAYPDVLRAGANGVRNHHGRRVNYCPNSANYRRLATDMARRLAERYARHPALLLWHVSNEYGGSARDGGACYCDTCAAAFRVWLRRRYGSLDDLNRGWWTAFWSHTYTDWDQIEPPYTDGETLTAPLAIDYRRFQTESNLDCFRLERDAIRQHSPDVPITTNMMGAYPHLDYRVWAPEVDVIAWDCYPWPSADPGDIAFLHDLNRGLKDGQPFLLMEQTPSSQNWQPVNQLKRPGVLRLWSYLAVAHGAESVMYFQWRRGRGGCEKFHGAVVEHHGDPSARVFREVSALGEELARLGDRTLSASTPARVAVVFDWDTWWALDHAVGPIVEKAYVATVRKHYRALWRRNVAIDVVFEDSDLSGYALVVAPMLHLLKPGFSERVEAFVANGGSFVTTYFSGVVDATDLAFSESPLRRVLGLHVEEIDALYEGQTNRIGEYSCGRLCELVVPEGADVLATYADDFYAGRPALTRNTFGQGQAYYLASDPEDAFLDAFYGTLLDEHAIHAPIEAPSGVEIAVREARDGRLLFVLNHTPRPVTLDLSTASYRDLLRDEPVNGALTLDPYDVRILSSALASNA